MSHKGQCFCGQVRVNIDSDPVGARICWCRDCQYIASGSATVNVLFAADTVHYEGDMGIIERVADSGNTVRRGFCSSCGSQMFSDTIIPKGLPMRVRAGTLDNPELMPPAAVIWATSAPKWAILDTAIPHHPGGPETEPMVKS